MNRSIICTWAGFAIAGFAQAQITFGNLAGQAQPGISGSDVTNPQVTFGVEDEISASQLFNPITGGDSFSGTLSQDPSAYEWLNSATVNYDYAGTLSQSSLGFDWAHSSEFDIEPSVFVDPEGSRGGGATGRFFIFGNFTADTETTLRFTIDFESFGNAGDNDLRFRLRAFGDDDAAADALNDAFDAAGLQNSGGFVTVEENFSLVTDIVIPTGVTVDFRFGSEVESLANSSTEFLSDQAGSNSGSFGFAVVPAAPTASLFLLGGGAAARRRRRS